MSNPETPVPRAWLRTRREPSVVEKKLDKIIELLEKIEENTRPAPVIWPYISPPYVGDDNSGNWMPCDTTVVSACCCSMPPGDGSTCAGGTCCCTEDYVCDKCKTNKLRGK